MARRKGAISENRSVGGLCEEDFMLRQRYVENSGRLDSCSQSVSVASHPLKPSLSSSVEVHKFIQEQRKIISHFRCQPWPMQMKMAASRAYKQNLSKYTNQMNIFHTTKDYGKSFVRSIVRKWNMVLSHITIWSSVVKQIEGRFGSTVASFFRFLRWLCALNLLVALFIFCLVVLPQLLVGHGLEVPASVRENGTAFGFFFDGKGYIFEYSILFYGYYDSGQDEPYYPPPSNPHPYIGWGYKLPLCYIGVFSGIFVFAMFYTLYSMGKRYKLLQRANVSEQYLFAWKVFASWDHTITNADTASSKARHIAITLKETIMEVEKKKVKTKARKWKQIIMRGISHTLIMLAILGSSYAIYLAVENATMVTTFNLSETLDSGWEGVVLLMRLFQVQAVVIFRNFILPYIFQLGEMLEKNHPRTALKVLLVRLFLMYISSLYVLIISLLTLSNKCMADGTEVCCWETIIGQELYKLVLVRFLTLLVSIAFADVGRWAVVQSKLCPKLAKMIGLAEFRLAENILYLVYGQAIIWLGMIFCPLLPLMHILKILLLFYVRAVVVAVFNKPPQTLFRVASTRNMYLTLLLLMTFLCLFPVGYAAIQMVPSTRCGPFRGLSSMGHIIAIEISTWPSLLQNIVNFFQTASAIIPLICILLMVIYYYISLARALKDINKDLRFQLHLEHNNETKRKGGSIDTPPGIPSLKSRHEALQQHLKLEQEYASKRNHDNNTTSDHDDEDSELSSLEEQLPVSLSGHMRVREVKEETSGRDSSRRVRIREVEEDCRHLRLREDSPLSPHSTRVWPISHTQYSHTTQL